MIGLSSESSTISLITRLIFATSEKCLLWHQRLLAITSRTSKLDELYAFIFYSWHTYEKQEESVLKMDFDKCKSLFSSKSLQFD